MERRIEAPPRRGTTGINIIASWLDGDYQDYQYSVALAQLALAGNNLNPLIGNPGNNLASWQ